MRCFARLSLGASLLIATAGFFAFPHCCAALQAAANHLDTASAEAAPTDPRRLYQAFNELKPDGNHVYSVHELSLRRDIISLTFREGKLAFLEPLGGRITGAVFTGQGHIFATPRDPGERLSLAHILGVPILDQDFSRAYLRFTDDTAREIEGRFKASGAAAASDPKIAESWSVLVASLNPWHSLRILFDQLSNDPLPYFYAGLESNSLGAFDVLVDSRRAEQDLIGQPRLVNGARSYDVWASFRAADAPQGPIEAFSPLDYGVETTIADDLSLEGTTTLHLKTRRPGERVVSLELSRSLAVREIKLEGGQPLVYFQNEDLRRRDVQRRGNDSVLAVLPSPAKAGEEFHLVVSYQGSVISDAGNGVEFVGERGAWYAHIAGSYDFTLFDLRFHWPKRFTLVATGTKIESQDGVDQESGRWRTDVRFAVAGFNLGEYKMESVGTGNPTIHLYANKQLEDAILSRLYQNSLSPSGVLPPVYQSPAATAGAPAIAPDLPLPSPAAVLKRLGSEILDSIHFYEQLNGPFPFDHLDISQIPGSFGQGWPELVYLSTLSFLPKETQERAGIAERTQQAARELMPFHEVAHQWWGNVVGSASYRDAWVEEGVANYLSLLYADHEKPSEHRLANWLEHFRGVLLAKALGSGEPVEQAGPLSFGYRIAASKGQDAYEAVIYGKGTWVIHMLHGMLHDPDAKDPDARFRNLLQSLLAEYRFRALSTADLERAVEKEMTPAMDLEGTHSMDWFFDQWVRSTGIPKYSVEFRARPHGSEFLVTGTVRQSGVNDVFTAAVPLYVATSGGRLTHLGTVVTTRPETSFHFLSRNRPTRILIDPHQTILCQPE
jgi:hypothetical protein